MRDQRERRDTRNKGLPVALEPLADLFSILLARIIHEYRLEAFETEARRGFSQVRPTKACLQSV
jgi:hypothetical protein